MSLVAEVGLQLVEFALFLALPYLGDELLGAQGEVAFDHPVVVGGLLLEDFLDGLSLVLTEVENLAVLGVESNMTDEVGPLLVGREIAERGDVADDELRGAAGAVFIVGALIEYL